MTENISIELDTSAMQQYAQFLRQAPRIAHEEMARSMVSALGLLERNLKELDAYTPTGATKALRGSIYTKMRGEVITQGLGVEGIVGSSMQYAVPVELGTKPHWIGKEGINSLEDWVKAKLGIKGKEARSVAFAIRNKIAVKGTKGAHMFERALADNEIQITAILSDALPRIAARLEAGEH